MAWRWIHEKPAYWDRGKAVVIGGAPKGALPAIAQREREILPGEWWRVEEEGGEILGYGWLDETWGEALILLAVAPGAEGRGVGSFILDELEKDAMRHGFRYMYNVVPPTHPDAAAVTRWLVKRGFKASEDGLQLRRTVREAGAPR